jgi:DNA-directed RNA polymerase I and III subunit RPAC2
LKIYSPDVAFSGYSVPHPSEEIMNVRIQTHSKDTSDVLSNNLDNIAKICDILNTKFDKALNKFNKK